MLSCWLGPASLSDFTASKDEIRSAHSILYTTDLETTSVASADTDLLVEFL